MTDLLISQLNKTFSLLSKFLNKNKTLEAKSQSVDSLIKEDIIKLKEHELITLPKYNSEINNKVGVNFYSFKYFLKELNWTGKLKEIKELKEIEKKQEIKKEQKNILFCNFKRYLEELNWTGKLKEDKVTYTKNKDDSLINSKSIFYKLDAYLKLINWQGKEILIYENNLSKDEPAYQKNVMFYSLNNYLQSIKWTRIEETNELIVEEKKEVENQVKNKMVTANFFSDINWD